MAAGRLNLKGFLERNPVISKISVKWGDMDFYRHVNNAMYIKYFEVSRLRYFAHLLNEVDATKFDTKKFSNGTGIGPIMSDIYCQFKFPVTWPDKLLVGSTVLPDDLKKDRYKLTHSVWSLQHQRVVADGYGTVVSYDFSKHKPCDIPDPLLEAIQRVQAKNLAHQHDEIAAIKDMEDEF